MNDRELFDEVLARFEEQYGLYIERPYDDRCTFIFKKDEELGFMNTDGYNLLYNLTRLCDILKEELI